MGIVEVDGVARVVPLVLLWLLQPNSVHASDAIVSNNWQCTNIGQQLLTERATVEQVYVAVSLCEGLVHPMDSGLGGGFQALLHDNQHDYYLMSREYSPWDSSFVERPFLFGNAIAVPAVLAGYAKLLGVDRCVHRNCCVRKPCRFMSNCSLPTYDLDDLCVRDVMSGQRASGVRRNLTGVPYPRIFAAVIDLAFKGFEVSSTLRSVIKENDQLPYFMRLTVNNRISNVALGNFLSFLAYNPVRLLDPYYAWTTRRVQDDLNTTLIMLNDARSYSSRLTDFDFFTYRATWRKPLTFNFRMNNQSYKFATIPKPAGGEAVAFFFRMLLTLINTRNFRALNDDQLTILFILYSKYSFAAKLYFRQLRRRTRDRLIHQEAPRIALKLYNDIAIRRDQNSLVDYVVHESPGIPHVFGRLVLPEVVVFQMRPARAAFTSASNRTKDNGDEIASGRGDDGSSTGITGDMDNDDAFEELLQTAVRSETSDETSSLVDANPRRNRLRHLSVIRALREQNLPRSTGTVGNDNSNSSPSMSELCDSELDEIDDEEVDEEEKEADGENIANTSQDPNAAEAVSFLDSSSDRRQHHPISKPCLSGQRSALLTVDPDRDDINGTDDTEHFVAAEVPSTTNQPDFSFGRSTTSTTITRFDRLTPLIDDQLIRSFDIAPLTGPLTDADSQLERVHETLSQLQPHVVDHQYKNDEYDEEDIIAAAHMMRQARRPSSSSSSSIGNNTASSDYVSSDEETDQLEADDVDNDDEDGGFLNAVSGTTNVVVKRGSRCIVATSSINHSFGSLVFSQNLGIPYNNVLRDFTPQNWFLRKHHRRPKRRPVARNGSSRSGPSTRPKNTTATSKIARGKSRSTEARSETRKSPSPSLSSSSLSSSPSSSSTKTTTKTPKSRGNATTSRTARVRRSKFTQRVRAIRRRHSDLIAFANRPRPHSVPQSSMCGTVISNRKTGYPVLAIGAAGGFKITSATFNILWNYFVLGDSFEKSFSRLRITTKLNYKLRTTEVWYEFPLESPFYRRLQNEKSIIYNQLNYDDFIFLSSATKSADFPRLAHSPRFIFQNRQALNVRYVFEAGYSAATGCSTMRDSKIRCYYDRRRGGRVYTRV